MISTNSFKAKSHAEAHKIEWFINYMFSEYLEWHNENWDGTSQYDGNKPWDFTVKGKNKILELGKHDFKKPLEIYKRKVYNYSKDSNGDYVYGDVKNLDNVYLVYTNGDLFVAAPAIAFVGKKFTTDFPGYRGNKEEAYIPTINKTMDRQEFKEWLTK